jgi:hypothetical protein
MRVKIVIAALLAPILAVSLGTASTADTLSSAPGLWSANYSPPAPNDCNRFSSSFVADANNFCYTNNAGAEPSVELGVKFTSSKSLQITGVRFYSVDSVGTTGSLWTSGGTRLTYGTIATSGDHKWQDLTFPAPVSIDPRTTYIASYHSPNALYAFKYDYFTTSPYTIGPITATQSVAGDGNGVYCYNPSTCTPSNTSYDSNYWVTPLWRYSFTGFSQPIDNAPTWNAAKAGSAIPVKFSLGADMGLSILKSGFPSATTIQCPGSGTVVDAVEQTVTAGTSSLSYDASSGQYTYVWKTDKAWAGKCIRFDLDLNDGSSHYALIQFTK